MRYSNFESYTGRAPMFQKSTVQVRENRFQLFVPVGSMFTVTTAACRVPSHVGSEVKTGQKGAVDSIPLSRPSFPLRYADDFQSTPASQNARREDAAQLGLARQVVRGSDRRL